MGAGSQYLAAYVDRDGDYLDGGQTYKLHLPPNIPVNNFWSVTLYDPMTRSLLRNGMRKPSLSSFDGPEQNADGSYDVFFGPAAPAGKEKNWVKTVPGMGWFPYIGLYGPLEAFFDQPGNRMNAESVAPSAIPFGKETAAFFATPRELAEAEILDLIQRFGSTAAIAKKAGFSGVQIHGAHGYLVSQFLSGHHNQRIGPWGNSAENRRRFVLEVFKAIRAQTGPDFPVGIKLNSADFQEGGFTEEESLDVIRALSDAGST